MCSIEEQMTNGNIFQLLELQNQNSNFTPKLIMLKVHTDR